MKYEKIGEAEHSHVVGNRLEKIEGNHNLKITGDQGIKIGGNHSLDVTGNVTESVTGNQSTSVTQNVYIKGMQVVIEAEVGLTIKMGPNFITLDPSGISISGVPLVNINSGGSALSGSPGSPVTMTDPTDPTAADDAQPGGTTSPPSSNPVTPANISLSTISPAQTTPPEADEPDRPAPASSPGGGGSPSPAEVATFPKDVDAVALAAAMKSASQEGVPFCEECQKAAQQQGAGGAT